MKKQMRYVLILVCFCCLLPYQPIQATNKTGYVYSYAQMLEDGGNLYYVKSYEEGDKILCKWDGTTGNVSRMATGSDSILKVVSFEHTLFYTIFENNKEITYSVTDTGKKKKKVCNGKCEFVNQDYIIYTTINSKYQTELYQLNRKTKKKKKIANGGMYFSYIKNIEDTLYFYKNEPSSEKVKILSMKPGDTKLSLLTTDKFTGNAVESVSIIVSDVIINNGVYVYQYGNYQGTGHYWYGTLKRIEADGKKSTISKAILEDTFHYDNNFLYYLTSMQSSSYEKYQFSTGKKTTYQMKAKDNEIYQVLDSQTYKIDTGNQKKIGISRFESGTKSKNLEKNFIQIPLKQNKLYQYQGEIRKLGDYYVIGITTMDYTDQTYGWRGKMLAVNWYIANKYGNIAGSFK